MLRPTGNYQIGAYYLSTGFPSDVNIDYTTILNYNCWCYFDPCLPKYRNPAPSFMWQIFGNNCDPFVGNCVLTAPEFCIDPNDNCTAYQPSACYCPNCTEPPPGGRIMSQTVHYSSGLNILSNPSNDYIIIENTEAGQQVLLYDFVGKLILTSVSVGKSVQIRTDNLAPGVYLITAKGRGTKRFVKL